MKYFALIYILFTLVMGAWFFKAATIPDVPVTYTLKQKYQEQYYSGSKYSVTIGQRETFVIHNDSIGYRKKYPILNDWFKYNVGDRITYMEDNGANNKPGNPLIVWFVVTVLCLLALSFLD